MLNIIIIIIINYTKLTWRSIIFSDESSYVMENCSNQYVQHHSGERFEPKCVLFKRNRSMAHVNVWGAFNGYAYTDLIRITGRFNSNNYIHVLNTELKPKLRLLFPVLGKYLHDNSPVHSSNSVKEWFNENHVSLLPMPPCSPDINLIENVWAYLEKVYNHSVVTDSNSLFKELHKCW